MSLEIVHAKTTEIDTKLIGDIFDVAGTLSATLGGPAFSLVDVMANQAYRNAINSLKGQALEIRSFKGFITKGNPQI